MKFLHKVAKILPRFSSDDAEKLRSLAAIERILAAEGLTWHEVADALRDFTETVAGADEAELPPPAPEPQRWKTPNANGSGHGSGPIPPPFVNPYSTGLSGNWTNSKVNSSPPPPQAPPRAAPSQGPPPPPQKPPGGSTYYKARRRRTKAPPPSPSSMI